VKSNEGRITFTPLTTLDHVCLKKIATAKGETLSAVTAYAVNQWLIEHGKKHLHYYGKLRRSIDSED
tara:strand:+ start:62 stop:262 length:201 start_codon:yes stop_codon:yes gene_type:complete